jgi:hypothetical protein
MDRKTFKRIRRDTAESLAEADRILDQLCRAYGLPPITRKLRATPLPPRGLAAARSRSTRAGVISSNMWFGDDRCLIEPRKH